MGCGVLPDWLKEKRSLYAIDGKDDNLCVWRCLTIFYRINKGRKRPAEKVNKGSLEISKRILRKPKTNSKRCKRNKTN